MTTYDRLDYPFCGVTAESSAAAHAIVGISVILSGALHASTGDTIVQMLGADRTGNSVTYEFSAVCPALGMSSQFDVSGTVSDTIIATSVSGIRATIHQEPLYAQEVSSVSFETPISVSPECVIVLPVKYISVINSGESLSAYPSGWSTSLTLSSGSNAAVSVYDDTVSLYAGPGAGTGRYNQDPVPWGSPSPYAGVLSINGVNNGNNVSIKNSGTVIEHGGFQIK